MAASTFPVEKLTSIPAPPLPSLPSPPCSYEEHRGLFTPIIVDNGATSLRWNYATSPIPFSGLNVVAKYKERKNNRPLLLFGEGVDTESGAKSQAKTPWEGDVLLNFDALENALDYAFIRLGIDTPSIDHPVFMTERLCSPLHSRTLTSELMFELYSVPSLAYCVDSIMSFYYNNLSPSSDAFSKDGLVISFNTSSTSIIPVLDGKGILSRAKRIPWGASQSSEYLLKLIQLKYPNFPTRVTTAQSTWMLHNLCEFATDYRAHLRSLTDALKMRESERVVQFPFSLPTVEEKSEEELARIAEKRKEQGRKLQEMAAKSRMEKLLRKETTLQNLLDLSQAKSTGLKRDWLLKLHAFGLEEDTLDDAIKKLDSDLKRARKKEMPETDEVEEPVFPLVDTPDADLDDEGLREKRKQKLLKAGFEARMRAKKEKEREKEEKEREEKREEEEREADLAGWAQKKRQEQETLMNRIKERSRRKTALSDRKSAAAQARMKSIANLAADDRISKKKKGGAEDMFGADDEDWAIYRKINLAAISSDEEEDLNQLQVVEQKLLAYDPTFTTQHTHASITTQRSALLNAFRPIYEVGDTAGHARIHLNTERWRACETWFSPPMAGVDSAGLGEVLQNILAMFCEADKQRLVNNVFLTGSPSRLPGLTSRLHATLRPILAPEMPIQITRAADPSLDAWKGMAVFSRDAEFQRIGVSRSDYEEYGGERVKKWWGGNWNGGFIP